MHVFVVLPTFYLKGQKLFEGKPKTEEGKICHFGWQLRKWLSITLVFGFLAGLVD